MARKLRASGDTEYNWGTIAKYAGVAVVLGAAIYLVYKKRK